MLKGQDFVILSHAEVEAVVRLMELVPIERVREAVKNNDLAVAQGLNLRVDLARAIRPDGS